MIQVDKKDISGLMAWLLLGNWRLPRIRNGFQATHPHRKWPLEITELPGERFETEDRNRFILDAYAQRHITAWAHYWGIALSLNLDKPMPGISRLWEGTMSGRSRVWIRLNPETVKLRSYHTVGADCPEAVCMAIANECDPELPNWEGWIDPPKETAGFLDGTWDNLGFRNSWEDGKDGTFDSCPHQVRHYNCVNERAQRGHGRYYCPICRFYYMEVSD